MREHTPGPWKVKERDGRFAIVDASGYGLAQVAEPSETIYPFKVGTRTEEGNAHMMSASCELFDALIAFVNAGDDMGEKKLAMSKAISAVAKAQGNDVCQECGERRDERTQNHMKCQYCSYA